MKVIKIGGGSLKGAENIDFILNLIAEHGPGHIFVVSALGGVTDLLLGGVSQALENEESIPAAIKRLKSLHMSIARRVIVDEAAHKAFAAELQQALHQLERLYYGVNFTLEITPRIKDRIGSYGEAMCVRLLAAALNSRGFKATYCEPADIGLTTDGHFGDATADLAKTARNFEERLQPILSDYPFVFIPGFYGVSETGEINTFGRGGSDYSAAVVAAALRAERLEVWKDVPGFLSADPRIVPDAMLIPVLSYEEAAELAYFGAKILHPRTIEPIRKTGIAIAVRDTMNLDGPGSVITPKGAKSAVPLKSVAQDLDIGVIKIYGSGVGARPGILATITGTLSGSGINIRSVITSQTCISLLLSHSDLERSYAALRELKPKPFRRIEKIENMALVGIVGDALLKNKGIAAQCFTAVAGCSVNVEMISAGPSRVALYFLLHRSELTKALKAIHTTFFSAVRECA